MVRKTLLLLVLASIMAHSPSEGQTSQDDPWSEGIVGTGLLLRRLDGVKRVLMIGAHPDDEDTALLAALSRGMGVETAYLSLSRGEGGAKPDRARDGRGAGFGENWRASGRPGLGWWTTVLYPGL